MTTIACLKIFSFDSHSNFHRRAADVVHAALHDHQIAEVNRLAEIDSVDRCGDARASRVTYRAHGGCGVHHRENDAAEDESEIVGVLRQHELGSLVLRFADSARFYH